MTDSLKICDQDVVDNLAFARHIAYCHCHNLPHWELEDLTQEAAIAMLQVARTHPDETWDDLRNLMSRAINNRLLKIRQYEYRRKREPRRLCAVNVNLLPGPAVPVDYEIVVRQRLDQLSAVDRDTIYKFYWLGLTTRELAAGRPLHYGSNLIQDAIRRCRRLSWPLLTVHR